MEISFKLHESHALKRASSCGITWNTQWEKYSDGLIVHLLEELSWCWLKKGLTEKEKNIWSNSSLFFEGSFMFLLLGRWPSVAGCTVWYVCQDDKPTLWSSPSWHKVYFQNTWCFLLNPVVFCFKKRMRISLDWHHLKWISKHSKPFL